MIALLRKIRIFMNKVLVVILVSLLVSFSTLGQQNRRVFLLQGIVKDSANQTLENATIIIQPNDHILLTDEHGEFNIQLTEGFYSLTVQYLNSSRQTRTVRLNKNIDLDILLNLKDVALEEVVVKSKTLIDVNSVVMGRTTVDIQLLKKLPAFLGEVDVIKSISALPGVVNAGEGASGFYVRGGGADQNLVLFDDAPVFNTAHLFGFFSVFNPDVLKSYTLHRSGVSAKFGGRVSSILEVATKEGNQEKMRVFAGISPITSKIGIDGPIGKKTTILLAARGAYPTYLMKLFPITSINKSNGNFYDVNFKINHKINNKNNLYLSTYFSNDNFKFPFDTTYQYKNSLGTLRWGHNFSNTFSGNLSLIYSKYDNVVAGIAPDEQFQLSSSILNQQIKADFLKQATDNQTVEFGAGVGTFKINPGRLDITNSRSAYNPVILDLDLGQEYWAYLNDEWVVNKKISLAGGLRLNLFQKLGPGETFIFGNDAPRSLSNIVETKTFKTSEVAKTYFGLEPRVSLKYSLGEGKSIKVGLSRTRQNIQLISNTSALTPADVWRLSNENIKPQIADQVSLGYFLVPKSQNYEFSAEVYYKRMLNQVDYKDGAVLLLNKYLEADLLNGIGLAYGSEFFLKKNKGDLTGWVSLSYSRALRKIAGSTPEETINSGKWYPSNYDRPINLNVFSSYQFPYSPWSFSSNFVFTSGRPVTAADSWFPYYGDGIYSNYYGRNQERMPAFYRLDVAFLRQSPPEKKIKTEWGISIYNLSFRKNAFSTLFKHYYGQPPQAYKLSVIGVAIPSLNYNIKF